MAADPVFGATPRHGTARLTAANTSYDGSTTTNFVDIITGSANGAKVTQITVQPLVTTTAGNVRIFIHDGTNYRLLRAIPIPAYTVAAGTPPLAIEWSPQNLILPTASWKLTAATYNAESFDVHAEVLDA